MPDSSTKESLAAVVAAPDLAAALKAASAAADAREAAIVAAEPPAEVVADPNPEPADPVDDIDVKVVATPDVNGYETIISITGAGRGRHVGSLRLIGPGGQSVILVDLDFNGPDWSNKYRSEFQAGYLRLPGSCEDDQEMEILPKPYDEGI